MKIDRKKFIEEYYSNQSDSTISKTLASLRNIENLVDNLKQLQQDDIALYSKLFSLKPTGNQVSLGKYFEMKALLINLEDFYGTKFYIPRRDELLKYSISASYFRSLDDLINKIDKAAKNNHRLETPYERLLFLKGIVVLGWYGFSLQQITNLQKSSVDLEKMCIVEDQKYTEIQPHHFEIIKNIKLLKKYKISKDVIINQQEIKWLFSCSEDKVSVPALRQRIVYFNKNLPANVGFSINYELLYRNNVFAELLDYEIKNKITLPKKDVIAFFNKKLNVTTKYSKISRYADYTLWKANYIK